MKIKQSLIIVLSLLTLVSCKTTIIQADTPPVQVGKTKLARVTYYWPQEGSGRYGTKDNKLKAGSCAADYTIFPYGTKIKTEHHFPWGNEFLVEDTGPAVKKRKAAKRSGKNAIEKQAIVIDVYCASKAEAYRYIKKYPMFFNVYYDYSSN